MKNKKKAFINFLEIHSYEDLILFLLDPVIVIRKSSIHTELNADFCCLVEWFEKQFFRIRFVRTSKSL